MNNNNIIIIICIYIYVYLRGGTRKVGDSEGEAKPLCVKIGCVYAVCMLCVNACCVHKFLCEDICV